MTEKDVKDVLMRCRRSQRLYDALMEEREQMVNDIASIKAIRYDSVHVSGGTINDLSQQVIEIEKQGERLNEMIQHQLNIIIKDKASTMAYIGLIDDQGTKALLIERYINGKSWKELCDKCHWSRSWAVELHDRGVTEIARKTDILNV